MVTASAAKSSIDRALHTNGRSAVNKISKYNMFRYLRHMSAVPPRNKN